MSLNFPLWEKDTSARPIVRGCRGKQHAAAGHAPPPKPALSGLFVQPRALLPGCSGRAVVESFWFG